MPDDQPSVMPRFKAPKVPKPPWWRRRAPLTRTGRLNPVSAKRRTQLVERQAVRAEVLDRQAHRCAALNVLDGHACTFYPDRPGLEVHELRGGSHRCSEWLDPSRCIALCPGAHDWVTDHKREAAAIGLADIGGPL